MILTDPNVMYPTGGALGGVAVLFIICVIVYYIFRVEIVLWFRSAFTVLYTNKGNTSITFSYCYEISNAVFITFTLLNGNALALAWLWFVRQIKIKS